MKYTRTIVETCVYTHTVEAESEKEAWDKTITVQTSIRFGGYDKAEKLVLKTACVASVKEIVDEPTSSKNT